MAKQDLPIAGFAGTAAGTAVVGQALHCEWRACPTAAVPAAALIGCNGLLFGHYTQYGDR